MPIVTRTNLANYIGRVFDNAELDRADLILRLAEQSVASYLGRTPETLSDDPPPPAEGVILACAARAMENPLALTSESVGPWSGSYATGAFALTRGERRMLQPYAGVTTGAGLQEMELRSPLRLGVPELELTDLPTDV